MTLKQLLCELADTAYDKKGDFHSAALSSQYDRLGSGSTRLVYKIEYEGKAYAVKFAYWGDANQYNRREARAWNTFRDTTRKYLAQVHGISTCGRVLAMELVPQTLEDMREYDAHQRRDDWGNKLRSQLMTGEAMTDGEARSMARDNCLFNIGVRANGDIVWIDYGVPVY